MSANTLPNTMTEKSKSKSLWVKLWPLYIIIGGLALAISQGWHTQLTPAALGENAVYLNNLVENNFWMVLLAFVGIYAAATAFMVPASALTIGGGFLFGVAIGAPATVIGATLGACALFLAAPAILGAKFRDYFITTAIGIIPGTVAYSLIGSGLRGTLLEAAEKGETADVGAIVGAAATNLAPAFFALAAVAMIPVVYKKFFKKTPE